MKQARKLSPSLQKILVLLGIVTVIPLSAMADHHRDHPVGNLLGAVIGGVIGHQFGGGDGKALATVAGAIIGGAVGGHVAEEMDEDERREANDCRDQALREEYRYGYSHPWRSRRYHGEFIWVNQGYYNTQYGSQVCRQYQNIIQVPVQNGPFVQWRQEVQTGWYCEQSPGVWYYRAY